MYNEIGQLKEKKLHSENGGTNFIHSSSYNYNERGWLSKLSSAHFSQELRYNNPLTGGTAQYNGNISQLRWGHGATVSETSNYPAFSLVGAGQVVRAMLQRTTATTGTVMSEVMSYDDMGNITKLTRDGGTVINYAYTGNRLTTLSGGLTGSYTYDANGNATKDRTGMTFTYNHPAFPLVGAGQALNLPKTATKTGTSMSYLYDALGLKLRKTATVGSTTTQRDYSCFVCFL